jgi:DNA-binding HxlR family transcriptional regulator
MLTQQLRELENDGIVHRDVYAEVPPKVEYSLTEIGTSVLPLLKRLCQWGEEYEKLRGVEAVCTGLDEDDDATSLSAAAGSR